jgi:glycerol-3-phosphate dehydrogenase (NAD(P)+)
MNKENPLMNITVTGCGRWGTFIAWYLDSLGHDVLLYGRENSEHLKQLSETRTNGLVTLGRRIRLTSDLKECMISETVIISIGSQNFREFIQQRPFREEAHKTIVLCMKGLEAETGKRLSEIAEEYLNPASRVAVWLGPGHVQDFLKGIPNCMVIDSENEKTKQSLVAAFSSELIRFYYGNDLIGNEVGAAAKNVVGIAAGALDGLGLSSLKGALMSRATREIAKLIKAMGGNELSAYGLCHLGDYEATVFSPHSHNRRFGEMFVRGERFTELAEGYSTILALMELSRRYEVELPICNAVYEVIHKGKRADEALNELFLRSVKPEF